MKIGIDARMFSDMFTGIGRYNFELTKRLFQVKEIDGKKIEWVIFMNDPQFESFKAGNNVRKVRVNAGHYSFAEQWKFGRMLEKEKCDLVHFTHFNLPLLYRRPFVTTIHDTTISFYPGKKMNVWWRKLAYHWVIWHATKHARHLITVSRNTQKDVEQLLKISTDKIQTIWNGLGQDFVKLEPVEVEKRLEKLSLQGGRFLLYTGVWREHKNLVGLIEAFGLLCAKDESFKDLKLVITGKEDLHYPEVKQAVADLGLQNQVCFVGLVPFDQLVALYNGAEAFVFPSFYEGFGFPPLEAMRVGTPVVASNAASIPEVCGEGALYFDPENVKDMAEQIEKVLTDKILRKKLIEKGRQQVQKFSWDDCAEQTLEVYKKAL